MASNDKELQAQLTWKSAQVERALTEMIEAEMGKVNPRGMAAIVEGGSSSDSFTSDADREVAQLDQQWNDLVDEYVADKDLIDF